VLIDLSPTSSGHYTLGTDSVLTTAYKLGVSTVLPTASTTYALYGRASSATDYLKILSTGYLSLDVNGTVVTSTTLATKDSKFREYSVTLSGNDFIFKEDDATISTVTNATAASKTLTLNLIGNSNGAGFYLGVLSGAVMGSITFPLSQIAANSETVDGVTATYQNIGTGTSVRDTYTLIDADYLGSELVINGNFATDSDWTKGAGVTIAGGKALINITDASALVQAEPYIQGSTYSVSFEVLDYVQGGIVIFTGFNNPSVVATSNGVYTSTASATATNNLTNTYVRPTSAANFTGSLANVSIKRLIEVA
jgi:hypothetical protein